MLSFMVSIMFVGALVLGGIAVCKAISKITEHVRENPEAGKSIFTHVILPVFGSKKRPMAGEHPAKPDRR